MGANQYINKLGEPETVYTELAHSVTELARSRKAEEALRVSEERYRDLFENSKDLKVIFDLKGNVTAVNKVALQYGFSANEGIGESMLNFVPKSEVPRIRKGFEEILQGKTIEGEIEIDTPKGKRLFEHISSPIREKERITGICGSYKDITDRKRAEDEMRESEQKFRNLFEKAHDGLVLIGFDGRIIDINEKATELAGLNREEIIGKPFFKLGLVNWKSIPRLLGILKKVFKKQPAGNFYVTIKGKTGESRKLEVNTSSVEQNGVCIGALAIVRDVTERLRAEEARCESEEKLKAILTSSPDAITVFDLNGNVVDLNSAAMKLQGFSSKEEIIGKSSFDFVASEDRRRAIDAFQSLQKTGQVKDLEFTLLDKKGKEFPILLSATVVLDSHKKPSAVVATFRDITELKATAVHNLETQIAIRHNQQKFEALFIGNPEAAVYLGTDFHIVEINPRFKALFGYSLDEIAGKHINDIIVPKDRLDEAQQLDRNALEGYVYFNTYRKRKDGLLIPVSVSAASITAGEKLLGYVAMYTDISDLKKKEENLAIMNEKLRVVGSLTRHDVRNKLAAITGSTYLMRKKMSNNEIVDESLSMIELAVKQIVEILEFSRNYEKLKAEKPTYVDVEKTFKDAVSLFENLKEIKTITCCDGLKLRADSLLRQIFFNLIDNSLKYGEKVTEIRLSCKKKIDESIDLVYEDDGVGISNEIRAKLFQEGFSSGKGTGYGLYLVRKIVEAYGWTIEETGELKRGATFKITIPKNGQELASNYLFSKV